MKLGVWSLPDNPKALAAFAKRLDSAVSIKPDRIVLLDDGRAEIYGSAADPYSVSLTECSCADFSFGKDRDVPCKHMIRLAIETGKADQIPVFDREASSRYDFSGEIEHLTELWQSGLISASAFSKCIEAIAEVQKGAKVNTSKEITSISHNIREKKPTASSFAAITGTPITGNLSAVLEAIVDRGYTIVSSVSKKTAFLAVFNNPVQEKITKAEALGVRIIHEEELCSHIENGTPFFDN